MNEKGGGGNFLVSCAPALEMEILSHSSHAFCA